MKRLLAILLCFALLIVAVSALSESDAGAYGSINQPLDRPIGWAQIVEYSTFTLGKGHDIGTDASPLLSIDYGTYPSIDGSTVTVPMAMEFARQHLGLPDLDLEPFVFFNRTHSAYVNLIKKRPNYAPQIPSENAIMDEEHPVDLILVTQPSDEESALAKERGVELIIEPVCHDAFVFIVHKDNPIESLTVEQIQSIYEGKIMSFAEVGGEDMPIAAYQRPVNSGSQTAMEKLVMDGKEMSAARIDYAFIGMGELVSAVGTYRPDVQSIGYTYLYYIDTLYKHEDIKVIRVEDVAPTPENLRSGAYPFATSYYGVIRAEDRDGTAGRFLDWMLTEEGQRCVEQAGYVPVLVVE